MSIDQRFLKYCPSSRAPRRIVFAKVALGFIKGRDCGSGFALFSKTAHLCG
ncbi:MAG: hypothetical protein LBB76_05785 [Azoarcus sp.]|jgi:hypothetical protein|nr:hypothetical protein [Azoarcus sp.]